MDVSVQDRFMWFISHVTQLSKEFTREWFLGMPTDMQHTIRSLTKLYQEKRYTELIAAVEVLLDKLETVEMDYVNRQQAAEHKVVVQEVSQMIGVVNPQISASARTSHFVFFRRLKEQLEAYNIPDHHEVANRIYGFFWRVEIILIVLIGGLLIGAELEFVSFFMLRYCAIVLALAGAVILLFRRTKTGAGLVLTLLLVLGIVGGRQLFS